MPHDLSSGVADEEDPVGAVGLGELDLDPLAPRGRQVLADVVGPDRQLAMAAVDEDGELDASGPPALEERLDRRPDRAARVEDVVDEDHRHPAQLEVERGRVDDRLLAAGHCVVAVEGDVDRAELDLLPAPLLDQRGEPLCERDAAGVDADEREPAEVVVALDDLVRDPRERALEALCPGDLAQQWLDRMAVGAVRTHSTSFPASLDRVKGSSAILARPADGHHADQSAIGSSGSVIASIASLAASSDDSGTSTLSASASSSGSELRLDPGGGEDRLELLALGDVPGDGDLHHLAHEPEGTSARGSRAPRFTSSGLPRSGNGTSIRSKSRGTTVSGKTVRASRSTSPPL